MKWYGGQDGGGLFHLDAEAMQAADFVVVGFEAVRWADSTPDGEAVVVETERRVGFRSVSEEEIGEIIMPLLCSNPMKRGSAGALRRPLQPKKISVLGF
jgi:hypothetical protein